MSASNLSNTSRITTLEQSSSGYVSATEFATFSNNAITKTNLSTHLPDHLSQASLNSNYLQTSAINSSMSNYLTTNDYLTSSTLTDYATTSNLESLSNSLSNYLKTEKVWKTINMMIIIFMSFLALYVLKNIIYSLNIFSKLG